MISSLLVALDESPYSTAAVDLAIDWGRRFDCLVVGIGVVDEPTIRGPSQQDRLAPSFRGAYQQMMGEAAHRVDRILAKFVLRCTEARVSHKILEDVGEPLEQILIESQRYDVIMVGQKSYFHFETSNRACDTVYRLLHASPRPVVVVPRDYESGDGVLAAYDGSVQSARALQAFAGSGLAELGPMHVACVHPVAAVEAAATAERAIEYLRFQEIAAQRHALVDGSCTSTEIIAQARRCDAGLIVMGAYGRPAVVEFFLGSVTRNMLEKTRVPLFLYH